jgi:hypothetical protein
MDFEPVWLPGAGAASLALTDDAETRRIGESDSPQSRYRTLQQTSIRLNV